MTFADRNAGGTGTYARSLLAALDGRSDLAARRIGIRAGSSTLETLRWLGGGARRALRLPAAVDLLHCPAIVAPWRPGTPYVVTIHDAAARHEPRDHPLEWRAYDRWFLPERARHARAVITGTRHSAADLVRHYGLAQERVRVTPYGIDEIFLEQPPVRRRASVERPARLLFPGAPLPRKNLDLVLRALAEAPRGSRLAEARLAITGAAPAGFPAHAAQVRELGLDQRVEWLGVVDFARLPEVLRDADLVVYPSRHEGFGFPPLEAMAVGTPVVSSTASCLPETLGDGALLVSPDDLGGFISAVESLLTRPALRAEMAERGRRWAAGFTWARCAEQTVAVYREVVGG